ncbi:MAG: alpha/beta hydrolase [Acidimicrobiales bacterium]|nr:alpha/beta hydrolase [Acidimicrobiales bacterium]
MEVVAVQRSDVEVRHVRLRVEEAGRGGPPLLLLHGFAASTFTWRAVLEPLAQHRRVVAFDRPGFGCSQRPDPTHAIDRFWYRPEGAVTATLGVIDALGLDHPVLVGSSAGGAVAVGAALARPGGIRALVLVDAAVLRGDGPPSGVAAVARLPLASRWLPWLLRAGAARAARRPGALADRAWHDPSGITPEIARGYLAPLRVPGWDRALWGMTREAGGPGLEGRLGELALPTLVVTGDDDRVVPPDSSRRLAAAIPGAELVVIDAAGHLPHEERPAAFLDAVERFLGREAPAGVPEISRP